MRGQNSSSESLVRQVTATFGRREAQPDPAWQDEFAGFLVQSKSRAELLDLFAQFRSGESAFDLLMRRVILRGICKHVGSGLQVGCNVVLKHPETMEFG